MSSELKKARVLISMKQKTARKKSAKTTVVYGKSYSNIISFAENSWHVLARIRFLDVWEPLNERYVNLVDEEKTKVENILKLVGDRIYSKLGVSSRLGDFKRGKP